jgi:hypothetical protein
LLGDRALADFARPDPDAPVHPRDLPHASAPKKKLTRHITKKERLSTFMISSRSAGRA